MIIINVALFGCPKTIETVIADTTLLYELLHIYEREPTVVQYTLQSSEGTITDMLSAFGYNGDFDKLVGVFNWKKIHGLSETTV